MGFGRYRDARTAPGRGKGRGVSAAITAAALIWGASLTAAQAETRALPFPAWPEPQIDAHMTVEQAKAIVAARTKRQTEWTGPTTGPKATDKPVTIAWVSGDKRTQPISGGAAA